MPIPIIGAIFAGSLVTKIIDVLVDTVSRRFLISAALIISLGVSYAVFYAVIVGYVANIDVPTLPTWATIGIGMLPSNTDECLTTIFSTSVARFLFDTQNRIISIRS